jgi:hypothetical protein
MTHNDYKEMIPAHALSALDAAEDRVLIEHLAGCEECRHELDDWLTTTAGLAFDAPPLEPSARVRQRILTQVHEIKVEVIPAKVVPFVLPKNTVWSSFGSLGAIAAALLFVGLIVFVVLLWRENRAIRLQVDSVVAENNRIKHDLELKDQWTQLSSSAGSKMSELNATPMAPGATAKLAFDKTGHAMLMTHGLPKAPEGKQYQLWFIVGTEKMPGKTFSPDAGGSGMLIDQVPSSAMESAVFAITLEPAGGVKAPTGQIYLVSRS